MKHWITGLLLLALVVSTPAWAGHVYIDPATCGPETSGTFVPATRLDNTGTNATYVTYQYPAAVSGPVMVCEFAIPPDLPPGTMIFQAQFHMRSTATSGDDPGYVNFGMSIVANARTDVLDAANPRIGANNFVAHSQVGPVAGQTFVITQTVAAVTDLNGMLCTNPGIECHNTKAVAWVQRLNNDDSCFSGPAGAILGRPWACCSGLGTGNCTAGLPPFNSGVELEFIDLIY